MVGSTWCAVQRPAEIINYRSLGTTPALLGGALAVGAAVAFGLTLISSVRRRRHDVALLKTLGLHQASTGRRRRLAIERGRRHRGRGGRARGHRFRALVVGSLRPQHRRRAVTNRPGIRRSFSSPSAHSSSPMWSQPCRESLRRGPRQRPFCEPSDTLHRSRSADPVAPQKVAISVMGAWGEGPFDNDTAADWVLVDLAASYWRLSLSAKLGTMKEARKIGRNLFPVHRKATISPSAASNVSVRLEFLPVRICTV